MKSTVKRGPVRETGQPVENVQASTLQDNTRRPVIGMTRFEELQGSLREVLQRLRRSSPDPHESPESDAASIPSSPLTSLLAERRTGGWLT
jgi:hypothetical protein